MLLDQDPTVLIIHEVYYALPCPDKLTTPKGFDDNDQIKIMILMMILG